MIYSSRYLRKNAQNPAKVGMIWLTHIYGFPIGSYTPINISLNRVYMIGYGN